MGVRTHINLNEANQLIKDIGIEFKNIEETSDGISDSTYIATLLDDKKCIFKIYEFASKEEVKNEIKILNTLENLPTPKALSNGNKIFEYNQKPIAIYSYLDGISYDNPTVEQVREIGLFLGKFHSFTKNIRSVNQNIYSQSAIKELMTNIMNYEDIDESVKNSFYSKYELVCELSLEENCVIHGDLFPDNAKFIGDILTGVFDFVEACNGHFFFDLAVVINSWCFDNNNLNLNKFNTIIEHYNKFSPLKVNYKEIKQYMMYAALFYACQRFNTKYIEKRNVDVKDYKEYLIKFESITKELE